MNKIMELAIGYASDYANGGGDKSALQAEVTRLEADELNLHASLAESVLHAQAGWARYENANNLVKGYQTELAELRAKLEAQEPVAVVRRCRDDEGVIINGNNNEISVNLPPRTKLYLAAGTKEKP